jgi:hypothetical protein
MVGAMFAVVGFAHPAGLCLPVVAVPARLDSGARG